MKVALIRYHDKGNINTRLPASLNQVRGAMPPLGLACIAAYLEQQGHSLSIIDAVAENLTKDGLRQRLIQLTPELVGITAMTSTLDGSLEAARVAKDCGARVVLGGPHLSAYPEETLAYDFVDFGIIGDGEIPMAQLIALIQNKIRAEEVKGLVYRKNGGVASNGPFVLMDLDSLPFPAYHLLPLTKYTSIISQDPMTTMITARGCPYRCGFCFTQPTDKYYRMINPVKVVDQMETLVKKYKIKEIMFYDDSITVNRQHIEGICREILSRKLKARWESPCRVDTVDLDLLKLMAKSGCFRLRFGVESGNQTILKLMNKRISLKQIEAAFGWSKQARIQTFAYFMVGYIEETAATMTDTINFAKKIDPDLAMFTVATPYPFTNLLSLAAKKGLIAEDYWREFSLGKTRQRLPYLAENSDYWVKKAYRDFYFRAGFVFRQITKINSFGRIQKMLSALKALLFFRTV